MQKSITRRKENDTMAHSNNGRSDREKKWSTKWETASHKSLCGVDASYIKLKPSKTRQYVFRRYIWKWSNYFLKRRKRWFFKRLLILVSSREGRRRGRSQSTCWGMGAWVRILYWCYTLSTGHVVCVYQISYQLSKPVLMHSTPVKRSQRALCEGRILTLVRIEKRRDNQVNSKDCTTACVPCRLVSNNGITEACHCVSY